MAIRNKIYIGSLDNPSYYFENDRITEAEAVQNVSLIGQELSVDSFTPTVQDDMTNLISAEIFRSSDGQIIDTAIGEVYAVNVDDNIAASDMINLDYGTPVWFYQDDTLVGKFYVESVRRTGANAYQIQTVSAIGVLNNMYHVGGLFTGTTFGDVLAHILASDIHGTGNSVIPYDIDDDVAELPVSGWLPYATKRQNLYQLVFANGVNIVKNIDGNPRFTFIYTAPSNSEEVDEEAIYLEGSMDYSNPYSKVSVMEHTYTEPVSGESTVLFDNTGAEAVYNKEVFFSNAPVVVSTITAGTGLTLVSATVNSAIVSGAGQLTGVPYLHSTKETTLGDPQSAEDKTISVPDCTMVNAINSQNLLLRLFAFYCPEGHIEVARGGIQYNGERCGKVYRLKNAFRETVTAYMSSMTFTVSSFNKADIELYANYTPAGQQGLYKNVIILDVATFAEDGGTFTVPDGVTEIKVVMIGGGTGGGSGWPGHNGEDAITHTEVESTANLTAVWYGAEGGDGGEGGTGGSPGKVNSVVIQNPSATYSYTIGTGGEGGAHTGYIPDTVDELRAAMENEHPDTEYTDNELQSMINTYENSGWTGSPNPGSAGTASTFGNYSSADGVAQTVYEPITDQFFAVNGYTGIRGGKGGARQIQTNGTFNWTTDGEDVTDLDGTVYRGGSTGKLLTDVEGIPEAANKVRAYGGNGAGAAVGIGRDIVTPQTGLLLHPHINGGSDQETEWYIAEDE